MTGAPSPLLHPDMAAVLRHAAALHPGTPDRYGLPFPEARRLLVELRRYWNGDPPALARVAELTAPGPARAIPVRLYDPGTGPGAPATIYLHGGGWAVGGVETHDRIMRLLALESGGPVFGVEYALAPENPFPAALEEVLAVAAWAAAAGQEIGADGRRLALAGDSAGANLALAAAQLGRRRELGRFAALVLFYGNFDFDPARDSYRAFGGGGFGLTTTALRRYWDAYLPRAADRQDWRAAPLHGPMEDLPPSLLVAAGLDPLRDETLALAHRMEEAGTAYQLIMEEGLIHGFLAYTRALPQARAAIAAAGRWIGRWAA